MPDIVQENAFIDAFIILERRERYKALLSNRRRRREFLGRLNHMLDYIPALAIRIPGGQHRVEGIANLLGKRGMKDADTVYIISDVQELDGLHLPLRQALERVLEAQFGSVVCCKPGILAYYRPEAPATGQILDSSVTSE